MKKEIFKLNEEINRIIEINGSNPISGKHFVVVDIQPEYLSGFKSFLYEFIDFLNKNYSDTQNLTFLFNGYDTLGMISLNDYKTWWLENGLDEEVIDYANWSDKGYAFFRYCMDSNIDEDNIVDLIKFMIRHNINDSREINEEMWDLYMEETNHNQQDVRDLLENADDMIHIPDLMDELKTYNNIILCGGGINECLKEVEIALKSLDKTYNILTKYCY